MNDKNLTVNVRGRLRNKIHNNKTQETRDAKNFPQGNHKGENPATSSEIESTPKVKPKDTKMISRQQ